VDLAGGGEAPRRHDRTVARWAMIEQARGEVGQERPLRRGEQQGVDGEVDRQEERGQGRRRAEAGRRRRAETRAAGDPEGGEQRQRLVLDRDRGPREGGGAHPPSRVLTGPQPAQDPGEGEGDHHRVLLAHAVDAHRDRPEGHQAAGGPSRHAAVQPEADQRDQGTGDGAREDARRPQRGGGRAGRLRGQEHEPLEQGRVLAVDDEIARPPGGHRDQLLMLRLPEIGHAEGGPAHRQRRGGQRRDAGRGDAVGRRAPHVARLPGGTRPGGYVMVACA
jgi:hypothetical protein